MTLTRLRIDAGTMVADRNAVAAVALSWCHEPDATTPYPSSAAVIAQISTSPTMQDQNRSATCGG